MFKRMMLWAALASMTSGVFAAQTTSLDRPYPERTTALPASLKSVPIGLAKAVLADINESAKLVANDPAAQDHLGYSVAIDGNTAIVGAYQKDGANLDAGAAYIYLRSGATWAQQQKLAPAALSESASFGRAVAIVGETVAVGAPSDDNTLAGAGAVYVFTRSGVTWTQQAKLAGSETTGSDRFGWSLTMAGNTLAVGSPLDDVGSTFNAGTVYVFTGSGATWTEQGRLSASDRLEDDQFGAAVAVSGDTLAIGAEGVEGNVDNAGAAYVFTRTAGIWSQRLRLTAAASGDLTTDRWFGRSVALDAGTLVVGEPGRLTSTGAAYVYTGSGASWTLQQALTASDAASGDAFGHSVAVRGDLALIGAYDEESVSSPLNRGSIYVFRRSAGVWTQPDKFLASDPSSGARFGFGVALSPGAAIVGAPNNANGAINEAGAAYVFHLGTPTTTFQILNPVPTTFGGTLGLSAQVSGGTPTGNVEFRNGLIVLATVPLNGSGVAATTIVPNAGNYSVIAHYLGDGTHLPSSSSATAFTVGKAATSLSLGSNNSPSIYGEDVTFTANVSTAAPGASPVTGSVEFRDDGALLATVALSGGTAALTIDTLAHDNGTAHPITAVFIANANFDGSTDTALDHVVNKATPTLGLASSPNPSLFGENVTITATLSGGLNPGGSITLLDDGTPFAAPTLAGGVATHVTSTLALGVNNLTAFYGGDANHNSALTAAAHVHDVLPAADFSVTKSNGTNFVQSGLDTTYTIVVTNPVGGADADGLLVNDTLNPAQFDVANADWSCAPAGICAPESGTGNIVDLPLDLPAGSSVTITLTVPVLATAESGVSNTVTLTPPVDVGDPDEGNNTATDTDGSGLFGDGFEQGPLN